MNTAHSRTLAQAHWLRRRDDHWELKIPVTPPQSSPVDRYTEVDNEEEILSSLKEAVTREECERGMAGLVDSRALVAVAKFTTSRESYRWEVASGGGGGGEWDGVRVDLDSTDFGYGVGEVEVMVGRREEMPSAEKRVRSIAAQLGEQRSLKLHVVS